MTPPSSGGAKRILDMGETLAALGHRVTILDITISSFFSNKQPQKLVIEKNFEVVATGLMRKTVLQILSQSDIVQFEFPYFFFLIPLMRILGKKCVLDAHDVEFYLSKNTNKMVAMEKQEKSSAFLNKILQHTPLVVYFVEWISVKFSTMVFACSSKDAFHIATLYKISKSKVAVVPNCGRAASYQKVVENCFRKPMVVFVGTFDHLPNIYGAKILVERIIPIVKKEVPDVLFVIVGPNPPTWLLNASAISGGNIVVTGEVDDVRPIILGSSVAVAPIYQGSGTRLKLIEYMHMGKPIVSTTKGIEGLDIKDNIHVIVKDDPSDFAHAIVELINDPEKAERMSKNCRKLALDKYSWETNALSVEKLYRKILKHF